MADLQALYVRVMLLFPRPILFDLQLAPQTGSTNLKLMRELLDNGPISFKPFTNSLVCVFYRSTFTVLDGQRVGARGVVMHYFCYYQRSSHS